MKVSLDDYSQYMEKYVPNHQPLILLVREKRREWMGCWGLLGLSLIIMDHSLIPDLKHQ